MTETLATSGVYISLEVGCDHAICAQFSSPLYEQLSSGRYDRCSVLRLPQNIAEWEDEHRTARKRAWRAERLGYKFKHVSRHFHVDDIYAINTSKMERQGRPMSAGYNIRPSASPDPLYPCPRHGVHPYGVFVGRRLVAYLWCYRAGDLALVSQILGHADHLSSDVMYLLMRGTIERELSEPGFLVYNRHDSGSDGLRYYKERCGFEQAKVAWAL